MPTRTPSAASLVESCFLSLPNGEVHAEIFEVLMDDRVIVERRRKRAHGSLDFTEANLALRAQVLDVALVDLIVANQLAGDQFGRRNCPHRELASMPEHKLGFGPRGRQAESKGQYPFDMVACVSFGWIDRQTRDRGSLL